ncbi:hypothetical protein K438DRAFT_1851801 [Mycena galopus ATCC 62051]|nr:hypothetical protein K438DRAFT_1851801 [Mycena galopus ATCC 62051]
MPTVAVPLLTRNAVRTLQLRIATPPLSPTTSSSTLTPLPPSPIPSSDSDSDSDSGPVARYNMSTFATVEQFSNRPPVLHEGDITPLIVRKFENTAHNYFGYKGTPDEQKTGVIIGCLRDERHLNWLDPGAERERVLKLTFPQFMAKLWKKYLKSNWEHTTRNDLLNSKMKNNKLPFDEWYTQVASLHALLANTPSTLDPTRLRHTLEVRMCEDLVYDYSREAAATTIPVGDLEQWLTEVRCVDKKHLRKLQKRQCLAAKYAKAEKAKAEKCKAPNDGDRAMKKPFGSSTKANTNAVSSSSGTGGQSKGCPKLMDEERALLGEHNGCFKCRSFYAGHHSRDCTNRFPDATTYRTLTAADATAAAAAATTSTATAATGNKKTEKSKAVTIIMHKVNDGDDSDNSEGTDELDRD